jgi:hypothetical protein
MKLGEELRGEGLTEDTLPLLFLESDLPLSTPGESDLCPLSSDDPPGSSEWLVKESSLDCSLDLLLGLLTPDLLPLGLDLWLLGLLA